MAKKIHKDPNKEKNDKIFDAATKLLANSIHDIGLANIEDHEVKVAVSIARFLYEEVYNPEEDD